MKRIALILVALLLVGCGVKRQTVQLTPPDLHVNPESGPPIVVGQVRDARQPAEGLAGADPTKNVGGVLRAGSGIAVDLDESVSTQMRQLVTQALRSLGYRVVANNSAPASAPRVAVNVTAFSVVMPINFLRAMTYTQKMIADVSTSVTVSGHQSPQSFIVKGHGENIYQFVTQENWEVTLNRAIADFSKNFKLEISKHQ